MSHLIYDTSAAQTAPLGEEYSLPGNRLFRYAKNGIKPLTVGTVVQTARVDDNHANLACAVAPSGATSVTVTVGGPFTPDEYKNGYLFVNDQAGEGFVYEIVSHPGGGGETTTTKKFSIKDPLVVALTTSSQATLIKNTYAEVNVPGGDPWDIIAGVAPVAVPADEYFWLQVRGPAVVLQAGRLFTGRGVMSSTWKPGAVEILKQVLPTRQETFPSDVKETGGTSTIVDGTAITITHGLGSTPLLQNITIVQGEDPSNAIETFYVDQIGATTFDVSANDPGASNLDFGWRAKAHVKAPYNKGRSEASQYQQAAIEQRFVGDEADIVAAA